MADLQFAKLLSMGYPADYIERAIEVHKKSKYGTNWNLSILVEIIGRLQEKDEQLAQIQANSYQPQQLQKKRRSSSYKYQPYYKQFEPQIQHQSQSQLQNVPPIKQNNNSWQQVQPQIVPPMKQNNNSWQQYQPIPQREAMKQQSVSISIQQSESIPPSINSYYPSNNSNMINYDDGLSSDSDDNLANYQDFVEPPFIPHYMNIEEPLKLKVNEFVDYRYENGRYLLCKIIAKSQQLNNMMLLHPVGKPIYDTKYDRLVDIYEEYYKLSSAKSICLRKIKSKTHIFYNLKVNDYIDINPFCNGHEGWKNGKIIKLDNNSSQIKVVYHNDEDNKNYSFWVHLQNHEEVAEFRTKQDMVDKHQIKLETDNIRKLRSQFTVVNIDYNANSDKYDEYGQQMNKMQINNPFKINNNGQNENPLLAPDHDKGEEKHDDLDNDEKESSFMEETVFIPLEDEDEDILTKPIDRDDIKDDEISTYLLKFSESKWEFNSNSVEIYRLLCNNINHGQMLPHPISMKYPQYFSSITLPPRKQFFGHVLPPKNKDLFPTTFKKWRVRIIVQETTTTELISKIVSKLQNSLKAQFNHRDEEFMLKVVGAEEYMLYDENKLIIDYEAVRKAVRNEDNVKFQLIHVPNLKEIERECFNKNLHHIGRFKTKYKDSGLLTDKIINKHEMNESLRYCKYSYGDGISLADIQQQTHKKAIHVNEISNRMNIPRNNNHKKKKRSEIKVSVVETGTNGYHDAGFEEFEAAASPSSASDSFNQGSHDPFNDIMSGFAAQQLGNSVDIDNINDINDINDIKDENEEEFGPGMAIPINSKPIDLLNGKDIIDNLPSQKDTEYLLQSVQNNEQEMLLHKFEQYYNLKITFLVGVTQFPVYKHYIKNNQKNINKKWAIIVRHELWIGDLCYDWCTFDTDYKHEISDGMRFGKNGSFKSNIQKYSDLSRDACISFTVYLCKLKSGNNNDKDPFEQEIPIAFVRFPIVDESNLLRNGKYSLNLWPIPVFIDYYKGPKCDAYENLSFKYRGPTIDRHLKRYKMNMNQKNNKNNNNDNDLNKELQNVFKLGIQIGEHRIEHRKCNIVALPLNFRWAYDKNNYKLDDLDQAKKLVNRDLLQPFTSEEKQCIWKHRDYLLKDPTAFTAFLRCVDWRDPLQRSEAYDYMELWAIDSARKQLENMLELLSYEFMDTYIREFCVMRISQMPDNDIQVFLLQFVQCLKYELHHNNALIRLIMRRALNNPYQIGHFLFWHLKSEYLEELDLNLHYIERFGLYLEEYLLFSQVGIAREILIQCNLSKALMVINNRLRREKKENKTPKDKLKEMMIIDLEKLTKILPQSFILPIQPKYRCTNIVVEKAKLMSSAQLPLWLELVNIDKAVDGNTMMMFKAGDDLRQDILTLQILRVLDKIWLESPKGLNLNLLPYNVVSTGDGQGMVEIVMNSTTTTHIHTHYGGGPQRGARDITTHLKYIKDVCENETEQNKARDIYARSCAGYSIASYVLGLGDRHPSNIMVRKKGELFHIDFSHFLGNFKSQKVIGDYVKWQREVAPFVFLPANKYCINNGNDDQEKYDEFIQFCVDAYKSLRQRHKLMINLFILMLPSQMPELIIKQHINYLRDQLHLYDIHDDNVEKHILQILKTCLNDKRRIMDNMIHAMVHS